MLNAKVKKIILMVIGLVFLLLSTSAMAVTYTGSLQYTPPNPPDSGDGIFVGPSDLQWVNYTLGISWTVTNEDNTYAGFPWKYTYTFGHNGTQAGISHVIIEGSQGLSASDITGLTGASLYSATTQFAGPGNPNMPEDLYGLKFDPLTTSPFNMTWTFWSNRAPVWGDFYARCGGKMGGINYAYNYNLTGSTENGFLINDVDPTAPAANGSLNYHILRPDTTVPEPSSLIALLSGIASMVGIIKRKKS